MSERHARAFGRYVRENDNWVSPALLLRSPDIFSFEAREIIDGTQFGVLGVPRLARNDLKILDGQHRILGLSYALRDISDELAEARAHRVQATRESKPDLVAHFDREIARLEEQRRRFGAERVSLQVHIEDDPKAYMQMFVDIADNALGITSAIRHRFDTRKVVNRALEDVLGHTLLQGRVDMEQDRVGGASPNLLGAKHVAEITRTVTVGIGGRVGRRQEDELHEGALVEATNNFLDTLVLGFPDLDAVALGNLTPEALRRRSLLGSATMLRVLAGVYHELKQEGTSDEDVAAFFEMLSPFKALGRLIRTVFVLVRGHTEHVLPFARDGRSAVLLGVLLEKPDPPPAGRE